MIFTNVNEVNMKVSKFFCVWQNKCLKTVGSLSGRISIYSYMCMSMTEEIKHRSWIHDVIAIFETNVTS